MAKKTKKGKLDNIQPTLFKIEIDFLNAEVIVSIADTILQAVASIDPNYTSLTGLTQGQINECEGLTIKGDDHYALAVCLQTGSDLNIIVHECIHAMNYIIEWFDLPLDTQEDELQAYLGAFLVDRVIDAINQHKKVNKIKD